jgi:mono/diheme cytochrome c family protein
MKKTILASLTVLILASLACLAGAVGREGSSDSYELQTAFNELPDGDAANGGKVFDAQSCRTCHVDLSVGPLFPEDPPLGLVAETRRPGYSAELYLYESIVEPNAYIVPGFQDSIMPSGFGKSLSEQELADLVAYLVSLK